MIKFSFLIVAISLSASTFVFADSCGVESWDSKRLNDRQVLVQGFINKSNNTVSIEVWRHTKLIGTSRAVSNDRGAFKSVVYTSRKSYKQPGIVISCN